MSPPSKMPSHPLAPKPLRLSCNELPLKPLRLSANPSCFVCCKMASSMRTCMTFALWIRVDMGKEDQTRKKSDDGGAREEKGLCWSLRRNDVTQAWISPETLAILGAFCVWASVTPDRNWKNA